MKFDHLFNIYMEKKDYSQDNCKNSNKGREGDAQ